MPDVERFPVVRRERPRRKGNRKLLFFLLLFFMTLLGVLFFQSSFSKIHQIEVAGNKLLTEEQIVEASGLSIGDHFFAVSNEEISRRVMQLGITEQVHAAKHFPGRITIEVKEYPVVALELTPSGTIAGLLPNGASVPYGNAELAASQPILTGWESNPLKLELIQALAKIPSHLLQDVSEIRPSPTTAYPDRILLYTRSKYEVITSISHLPEKISLLDDYVYGLQSSDRTTGRIILLEADYGETFDDNQELSEEG